MSGSRGVLIGIAAIAVLLGIFAAANNFMNDQVGWNTAFTVVQTLLVAGLMVIVARDGAEKQQLQY